MKIGISGKGGTGKTTVSATLARLAARRGMEVLAIDCDSNPNLGASLGLDFDVVSSASTLPKMARGDVEFLAEQLINEHAIPAPDGVRLVLAARVDQAASG